MLSSTYKLRLLGLKFPLLLRRMNFTVLEYQKINHKVTQSLILWQLV